MLVLSGTHACLTGEEQVQHLLRFEPLPGLCSHPQGLGGNTGVTVLVHMAGGAKVVKEELNLAETENIWQV